MLEINIKLDKQEVAEKEVCPWFLVGVLEKNKKKIMKQKYAYQKARKILEVLEENEIPKSNEVLKIADKWFQEYLKEE